MAIDDDLGDGRFSMGVRAKGVKDRLEGRFMSKTSYSLACYMTVLGTLVVVPVSSHSQTSAEDVAAQVREQGYPCVHPVTAVRDVRSSRPNSAVWVLRCRNATYRVRLDPDMSARVTKLRSRHH